MIIDHLTENGAMDPSWRGRNDLIDDHTKHKSAGELRLPPTDQLRLRWLIEVIVLSSFFSPHREHRIGVPVHSWFTGVFRMRPPGEKSGPSTSISVTEAMLRNRSMCRWLREEKVCTDSKSWMFDAFGDEFENEVVLARIGVEERDLAMEGDARLLRQHSASPHARESCYSKS
jgi:hypothetical protein